MAVPAERPEQLHGVVISSVVNAAIKEGEKLQVGARWVEAEVFLTGVLERMDIGTVNLLNRRGLNRRMQNHYSEAEHDYSRARELAHSTGNLEGELDALGNLVDLVRTGDNDPTYVKGVDLVQAQLWRDEAIGVMNRMPEGWSASRMNAFIQFGLLSRWLGQDEQAVKEYSQAEDGCKILLLTSPEDNYLLNRLARVLQNKGVALGSLGRYEEAIAIQEETLEVYKKLRDVRGKTNCALGLGRLHKTTGNIVKSAEWFNRMKEFSQTETGKIIDEVQYKLAEEELAKLPPQ